MLTAAALMCAAVVLGLLTTQGSYALWQTTEPLAAGSVRAADFKVALGTARTTVDMTLEDGTPASLVLETDRSGVLLPGEAVRAGLSLTNLTAAGAPFTIRARMTSAPLIEAPGLAEHLTVTSAVADRLDGCADPGLYASVPENALPEVKLGQGESGVLCFQVALGTEMPAALEGTSATITIPLAAAQI